MIKLLLVSFLCGSLIMCCSTQECSSCTNISLKLSTSFLFMKQDIKIINISNDRIFINGNNSWIKFFDITSNNSYCSVHAVEINSPVKLVWLTALVNSTAINFNAKHALIITWFAIGGNKCDASNFFQVIFTADNVYNLVIFNFIKINYDSERNFNIGVQSNNISKLILTNHSQLLSNSNVGINGKWIFIINNKNNSCTLNYSLVSIGLFFFYIILNTIN